MAEDKQARVRLRVSKDGMTAWLRVLPARSGADGPGGTAEAVTPDDLLELLQQHRIVYGLVERAELWSILKRAEEEETVVAQGLPPLPGVDAQVRYLFGERLADAADPGEGTVNFLERNRIPSVSPGEVLAVKVPPQPGRPGINVYGEFVEAPPPRDVTLKPGTGTALAEGGNALVATISGRPVAGTNTVSIYAVYTVPRDVNAETGHIRFKGDVLVQGNVTEGMEVEATGRVEVYGMVVGASIIAGGDVVIHRNLMGSTVRAGGSWILFKELADQMEYVLEEGNRLLLAVTQLKERAVATGREAARLPDGALLKVVLEKQLPRLPQAVEEMAGRLKKLGGEIPADVLQDLPEAVEGLQQRLVGLGPTMVKEIGELGHCLERFREASTTLREMVQNASRAGNVQVGYLQNSRVEASGNVHIRGKGSYYGDIYAGGKVTVDGSPGIFRNGSITAGGDVRVRELGSPSEARTTVEVPLHCYIIADTVHPGVTMKAGPRVERVRQLSHGVRFH